MPVISFVSPKGGAGKSTAALLLSSELALKDIGVTVIDCDPEQWIHQWGQGDAMPEKMRVVPNPGEDDILDAIEDASKKTPFVIVDLEGSANRAAANAVAMSDFCIIPMQPSTMDAKSAAKAIKLIKQQERVSRRDIPFAVLFTRTSSLYETKLQKALNEQLTSSDIPVFQTHLLERVAFKHVFNYGCPLADMPKDVSNLAGAIENAQAFAVEVVSRFKSTKSATPEKAKEVA